MSAKNPIKKKSWWRTQSEPQVRSSELVRRAAAKTLLRLKRETVLRPIGPICLEEWKACRDIISEEMEKVIKASKSKSTPNADIRNAVTGAPDCKQDAQ